VVSCSCHLSFILFASEQGTSKCQIFSRLEEGRSHSGLLQSAALQPLGLPTDCQAKFPLIAKVGLGPAFAFGLVWSSTLAASNRALPYRKSEPGMRVVERDLRVENRIAGCKSRDWKSPASAGRDIIRSCLLQLFRARRTSRRRTTDFAPGCRELQLHFRELPYQFLHLSTDARHRISRRRLDCFAQGRAGAAEARHVHQDNVLEAFSKSNRPDTIHTSQRNANDHGTQPAFAGQSRRALKI